MAAPASTPTAGRLLGGFERFTVSKANILRPSTVAFLASFQAEPAGAIPHPVNPSTVKLAVGHLLRQYPLLRCGIAGGRTRTPSFAPRDDTSAEEVVVVVQDEGKSEAQILDDQVNIGLTFDGSRGPLWRVTLYEPSTAGAGPRLSLASAHTIADGSSIRNTFQRLLTLLHPLNQHKLSTLPELVSTLPPALEETVDTKPNLRAMLRLVKDELIKPKFRAILPPRPPKLIPYPEPRNYEPIKTTLLRIPPASTAALKAAAKAHGLATLHPLLQGVILAAVVLASTAASRLKPGKKGRLNSITPISLRDPKLGHPDLTGNYISALSVDHSIAPSSSFFAVCREYAARLNSPAGRTAAKHLMGALALIPNPKPKPVKPGAVDERGNKLYPVTGFDTYMIDHRDGVHPSEGDVSISNLTILAATGWEGEGFKVCWGQTVGPYEGPLTVSIMSIVGGEMTIVSNWIQGTMEENKMAERYVVALDKVVASLVSGVEEGVTIEKLARD